MKSSIVKKARATPVRVQCKPDTLNSEGIDDTDAKFAQKFKTGAKWSDFDKEIKWIVELETADGVAGIGETYRGAEKTVVETALAKMIGIDVLRMNWRAMPTGDMRAYDGFESAVMDLAGKLLGVPVHQLLGGAFSDRIECTGWTGRRTPKDAARKAHEWLQRGHHVFKFKCSDKDSVREWSEEIQKKCGDGVRLLLDPNQRWHDVATTMRLMEGVKREMMYALEDPIERSDYKGFRELKERLGGIPIFMHISVPYKHQGQKPEDLITALRERCADGFNFNGPMFEFVRLSRIAALEGLPAWHGSEVDLGIKEVSALHAAAAVENCTIPSDIFGDRVREDDLIEKAIVFDGAFALVPQMPGLGIELDRKALEKYKTGPAIEEE